MGEVAGMALAGSAASAGGSMLGNAMGGSNNSNKLMDQYNFLLQNAMNQAIQSSTDYTNQAISQTGTGLTNATNSINSGVKDATKSANAYTNAGFNMGQALLTPYREGGYSAQNAYLSSMGLPTVNTAAANQQYLGQQAGLLRNQLYGDSNYNVIAPGAAPTLDPNSINQDQINQYLKANSHQLTNAGGTNYMAYTGVGSNGNTAFGQANTYLDNNQLIKSNSDQVRQYLAQQQNAQAQKDYQSQADKYNQYQQFLQQSGYDPNAAQQPLTNPTSQQDAMSQFFNSPQYQLLFGNNQSADPAQRFQADPGYEFAQSEAAKKLQQYGASKGLLESGPLQVELQKQAQGMADQNYQRWLTNQQGAFQNYQQNLAQTANLGSGLTGANTAASLYSGLGNNIAGMQYGAGNTIGQANLSSYQDIASLLANQGVLNANAYLNTGAAQAQGLMTNAGMQMQQNSANQANMGYQQAAQGLFNNQYTNMNSTPQSYLGGSPVDYNQGFQAQLSQNPRF